MPILPIYVFLLGFISLADLQQPIKEPAKRCLDEKCQKALFSSPVVRQYISTHQDFLTYKPGQRITVYGVAFGDRPDLWEGEVDGKRGFFFANHVDKTPFVDFVRRAVSSGWDFFVLKRDGSNAVLRMETAKGALRQAAEGFLPDVQWDQKPPENAENQVEDSLLASNPLSRRKNFQTPPAENSQQKQQQNIEVTPTPAPEATSPLAQRIQRMRQQQEQKVVVEAQIPPPEPKAQPQAQASHKINVVDDSPETKMKEIPAENEIPDYKFPELLQQFLHFSESELKEFDWLLVQAGDPVERQELVDFVTYQLTLDRSPNEILAEAKGFVVTNFLDRNPVAASKVDPESAPKTEPPMGSPIPLETPVVQPPVLSEDASKIHPTETLKQKVENFPQDATHKAQIPQGVGTQGALDSHAPQGVAAQGTMHSQVPQEVKVAAQTLPPLSTPQPGMAGQTLPLTTAVPITVQKMPKEEERVVPMIESTATVAPATETVIAEEPQRLVRSATIPAVEGANPQKDEHQRPIATEGTFAATESPSVRPEGTLPNTEQPQLAAEKSAPVPDLMATEAPPPIKEDQKLIQTQFAAEKVPIGDHGIPATSKESPKLVPTGDQNVVPDPNLAHKTHLVPETVAHIPTGGQIDPSQSQKAATPPTPDIKIEPSSTLGIPKPLDPTPDLDTNATLTVEPNATSEASVVPKDTVTPSHVHGPGCDHDHGPPATAWSHIDKLLDDDPFKAPAIPTLPSWPLDESQAAPPIETATTITPPTIPVATQAPVAREGAPKVGFGSHWSHIHHGHSHNHDHDHHGHSHDHQEEPVAQQPIPERAPEPTDPYLDQGSSDPYLGSEVHSLGQAYCTKEEGCGPGDASLSASQIGSDGIPMDLSRGPAQLGPDGISAGSDGIPVDLSSSPPLKFWEKVKNFFRRGRERLQPVARILRVILRNLKFWLVPKDFQDEIGEREIFLTLLTATLGVFFLLSRSWAATNERKIDLNFRKFADLTQKFRILELENKKLHDEIEKGTPGADPDLDKALKKAQECAEQLKLELLEVRSDRDQIRESNAKFEGENNSLRAKVEKFSADLHENHAKLADLEAISLMHSQCDEQLVELRSTCEFARERATKLEADLEQRNVEILDLERQREECRDEIRDFKRKLAKESEKFDEKLKEFADLEEQLRAKQKEIEILKDSVAALEAETGLKGDDDFGAEDSSGWDVDLEEAAAKKKQKLDQFLDVAKLRAELKSANAEMDRLKSALGAENDARRQAERQLATERAQFEDSRSNFRDLEKKLLQTETKLTCLTEYFQKKEAELQKQLGAQELLAQKHKDELGGQDEESRRLKDETADLQRMVTDLKRDIQDRDREFSRFRQETERFKHENWRSARHLEQERDSLKAENNYLRRRLADVEKSLVSGSIGEVQDATSNNSSDAELAALSAARRSPPSAGVLDDMPPPPPPNLFMAPPPAASPFFGPPSDYWSGDDGYDFAPPPFGMPPIRRSQRRARSRGARGGDRRSPSPPGAYAYDDMPAPRRPGGHRSKSRGRKSEGGYHSPPSEAEMRGPMRMAASGVAPPALKSVIRNGGGNSAGLPKSDSSFDSPPDRPPVTERRTPKGKSGRV